MSFSRELAQSEIQTTMSRICTWVAESILYNNKAWFLCLMAYQTLWVI